jgi:ATP-binding protein involved in chromosome partitioning
VGLIDADIYGPSIPMMFGFEGAKPQTSETADGKTRIQPITKYGIQLLSIGFFTDPNQPVPWRGPMASTAVTQYGPDRVYDDYSLAISWSLSAGDEIRDRQS